MTHLAQNFVTVEVSILFIVKLLWN